MAILKCMIVRLLMVLGFFFFFFFFENGFPYGFELFRDHAVVTVFYFI